MNVVSPALNSFVAALSRKIPMRKPISHHTFIAIAEIPIAIAIQVADLKSSVSKPMGTPCQGANVQGTAPQQLLGQPRLAGAGEKTN